MTQSDLRMGGFRIAQIFFGAIGHLMQGTGIVDIMVEADVRLRGTANKIISGNAACSYYGAKIYVSIIKQSCSNVSRRHDHIHS